MSGPSEYVGRFIDFCANKLTKNPVMKLPTTKSSLSGEFINEMKVPFSRNYIISSVLKPHYLLDNIRSSKHSIDMQVKLLVLLSLPVDDEYFEKLNKIVNIELDEYGRIDQIGCDGEVIDFLHRRPQAQKRSLQEFRDEGEPEVKRNLEKLPLPTVEVQKETENTTSSLINPSLWEDNCYMDICKILSGLLDNPSAEYQRPIFLPRLDFKSIEFVRIRRPNFDFQNLTSLQVPSVVEPIPPVEEEESDETTSPLEVALKVLGEFGSI